MKQIESFFWGIIAALGALVVELLVFVVFSGSTDQASTISFTQLFVVPQLIVLGACIEEVFKYIVISKRIEMLSLRRSYLINSFLVGLGFFSIELGIILATRTSPATNLLVEIAIIHIGTSGIIGYLVATRNPKKIMTLLSAVILTTFLHSIYNILIMDRTIVINFAILALLTFIIIFNIINFIRIDKELARD